MEMEGGREGGKKSTWLSYPLPSDACAMLTGIFVSRVNLPMVKEEEGERGRGREGEGREEWRGRREGREEGMMEEGMTKPKRRKSSWERGDNGEKRREDKRQERRREETRGYKKPTKTQAKGILAEGT